MGKKGPLWWRESDWLLRGSSAANQILLRHSGPILSMTTWLGTVFIGWIFSPRSRRTAHHVYFTEVQHIIISSESRITSSYWWIPATVVTCDRYNIIRCISYSIACVTCMLRWFCSLTMDGHHISPSDYYYITDVVVIRCEIRLMMTHYHPCATECFCWQIVKVIEIYVQKVNYRSGKVNSNTVNSKFHLIWSFFEIFARFLSFHFYSAWLNQKWLIQS